MKSIAQWTHDIHQTAVEKGWWHNDQGELIDRNPLELQMLVVSEIAEACEEARKGTPPIYQESKDGSQRWTPEDKNCNWIDTLKPEGELIELADAVIRIMDICGRKGWDLEKAIALKFDYNKSRPHRHGNKKF